MVFTNKVVRFPTDVGRVKILAPPCELLPGARLVLLAWLELGGGAVPWDGRLLVSKHF